ncbi:C6 transcription factor (Ctf1B) [Purpureocillium lilacinum]|uniref:C6 transcription factor (Ctf1B) n=1 Tax=Purpureocillium lilacinum TaxID=33203 RepID=A0A179H7U9_PURLI|nr:C6 transcription factor (Ctf1B) [Purpureocillium lilacinum]OAQ77478.1 C6 transcription factor (Ctf1B) [Purpureocillium lilacinum]OAQ85509.1 C6 transcription factor (Ctf1B) [Purpureocillium lilacinum]
MALDTSNDSSASGSLSPSPSVAEPTDKSKKRAAPGGDNSSEAPQKVTKRRAARACVSCRARKVRCDVVEGAPCGNCRWDNVECIVQESRRRKKNLVTAANAVGPAGAAGANGGSAEAQLQHHQSHQHQQQQQQQLRSKATGSGVPTGNPLAAINGPAAAAAAARRASEAKSSFSSVDGHVPHMIYQRSAGYRSHSDASSLLSRIQSDNTPTLPSPQLPWNPSLAGHADLFGNGRTAQFLNSLEPPDAGTHLPPFVRPLPSKIAPEDVQYLHAKGALTLPSTPLQNGLLQSYVEYVHPYMPLMDLHGFLNIVNRRDGLNGQTSLLLYQAMMFSATAFVDMKYLREAGYATRKAARKAFFQKTRLLYDFDYESDRLVLVQALMLMTYWYETPDDQKDTWHWMGVAISLAHTIGLHRNPEATSMSVPKQRLWKRIWWSCFMRDRLIALGMRRPTRIKDEDFDVPMLVEADFEIQALPESNTVIPKECRLMRDVAMQRELATMCIAKAKLCVCISHMLKAQYSVLIRDKMKPENTTNSTMMLFPNKQLDNVESINAVDIELSAWAESLPECCNYRPLNPLDVKDGKSTIAVQRTLLHMVYHTTISALHRPQFLPSSPSQAPTTSRQTQEISRLRVRDAASQITRMATELHHLRLERYLPTTGVTVILPAMIIHLLEMKNPTPQARDRATKGFRQCMRVMEKLREIYAAADYATGFLDAALRKAAIDVSTSVSQSTLSLMKQVPVEFSAQTPPPENVPYMTAAESLFHEKPKQAQRQTMLPPNTVNAAALELSATSPPQTDFDSAGMTPSASGGSDAAQIDLDAVDLDFMQGHDEFDWNAVAGTDFDVDQWLQFPPEGVNGQDDGITGGVFGANGDDESKTMEQVLSLAALDNDGDTTMQATEPSANMEVSAQA